MEMTTGQAIRDFLEHKSLALVGFSRSGRKFSNTVYRELTQKGYRVFPINPAADQVGDVKVFKDFTSLPEPVSAALLIVPRSVTARVVHEAADAGVTSVWIQPGAESREALQACQERNVSVVSGLCILMFAEPAIWYHRVHRGLLRLIRRLPVTP
ncbi:MAG TPA: CoA-binding protein [Acidobacteriota bacterium]|jgi:hypothetical protein|nr:CoA-binding protein [Acidobacteriota bacterium]